MADCEWYRNTKWNQEIEEKFRSKLKRARRKEQYLRIQSSYLAKSNPTVSLSLLDEYFSLEDKFDWASGYCIRAEANIQLGNIQEAVESYEVALSREVEFPKLLTNAYLDYPLLVVKKSIDNLLSRAIKVLDENKKRLMFPVDFFLWNGLKAVLLKRLGDDSDCKPLAQEAINYLKKQKSGFAQHQKVGLVNDNFNFLISQLNKILDA